MQIKNLRRAARWCRDRHVIMEDHIEQQPVAKDDQQDGQRRAALPVEWQPDPVGYVHDGACQTGHANHKELRSNRY